MQSKAVLERPWCLVELITALEHGIPIVGVSLTSGAFAYDFGAASSFLEDLDELLDERNPGALGLLQDEGIDVAAAAWKLSLTLPAIISTPFNPSASKNMLEATLRDVVVAIEKAHPLELPSRDKFLLRRARSSSQAQHGSSEHHATAPAAESACATVPLEVPELPAALQTRPALLEALLAGVFGTSASTATTSLVGMTRAAATTENIMEHERSIDGTASCPSDRWR